jgi:hypothetical protein
MPNTKHSKFVVLFARGTKASIGGAWSRLGNIPGVEVVGKSDSFVDVVVDEETVDKAELESIVVNLGGELHALPGSQLMDPIPTRKIP